MSTVPPTGPGNPQGNEGPQPYWQPPQVPAPPMPDQQRRKSWFARHKILTGLLAFVGLGVLAGAFGGNDAPTAGSAGPASVASPADASSPGPTSGPTEDAMVTPAAGGAPSAAKVGAPVRDGKFEFTVTKVEKGVKRVGGQYVGQRAQGQFVLVHVTVRNIGDEAQTFFDSEQKVRDGQGREFSADTAAGIVIENNDVFVSDINPGNTVKGILVYDMPKGTVPVSIELHDSMFSGGVTVDLR